MITIIILVITFQLILFFYAKKILLKVVQVIYERALLKGDRKRCDQLGKFYYISLKEEYRKAKGIISIESKISDDFRSFNH